MIELLSQYPIVTAPVVLLILALLAGTALGCAAIRVKEEGNSTIADRIDAVLPQSQCGQCGHPGCRPYAEAVAAGEAINRCLPGGDATIRVLANMLGVAPLPLDVEGGVAPPKAIAYIREAECIGCTKCIQACPVDAILGAAKLMHTVIADECTGCDLCVEPCPVDCIEMRPLKSAAPRVHPLIATDSRPHSEAAA